MNFQTGRALQNNSSLLIFTHTIQTHRLIIPKPHFSSREGINCRCRRFDLLVVFAMLAQSVAAMTTLTAHVLAGGPAGRW